MNKEKLLSRLNDIDSNDPLNRNNMIYHKFKRIKTFYSDKLTNIHECTDYDIQIRESIKSNTCLCGHQNIVKINVLKHKTNLIKIYLGSCCIKKFWKKDNPELVQEVEEAEKEINQDIRQKLKDIDIEENPLNYCTVCSNKLRSNNIDKGYTKHLKCANEQVDQERIERERERLDPDKYIMTFGKYKDRTFIHVTKTNINYLKWIDQQNPVSKNMNELHTVLNTFKIKNNLEW